MRRLVIVLALALVLAGCAPTTAHNPIPPGASSNDVAFLNAMSERGITNTDGSQAQIDMAHQLCGLLAAGMTVNGLAEHYKLTTKSTLSSDDMHFVIETAAATYCPQYLR